MGDRSLKAVSGRDFCKALQKKGWTLLRIRGSHHFFDSPDGQRRVSVPVHGSEILKRGTLAGLLRQAGMTDKDI